MTNQQHPDQFDWATELSDAEGHVTLSAKEAHEIGARLRRLHSENETLRVERERNLNSIRVCNEIINKKRDENETLQAGYAAARLEIESLRARSAEPAGEYPELPGPVFESWAQGGLLHQAGFTADQLRAYVDADRAARAPADSVAAPAGGEIDRLRAALVYVAFALHDTPQHMLAEGITLIDGDTVRVSRDGWTVEASVNPARATPPAQAADSVLEDAALLDWLLLHISGAEFRRIGVHYSGNASRADVDAARKQGANHD